jgi:HEAT repeat protein
MAQSTRSAIPDLRIALENRDPSVRILAAMSLARISPQTEGIAPVLREGLTFNDYAIREQVFNAIQEIGPAARVCAPELIRVLKNKNEGRFRSKAAFALLSVDPSAPELGPAFAALVKHPDPQVRMDAFNLLGRVNLTDKALLTTLLDMVRDDPTGPQQYQVFDAIARFGAAASEELSKRLNDKDPLVRAAFLNLYVRTGGANADEFYATLDRALKDDAPGVRLAAASTLLGRDRESKKALESVLPVVKQCLESADFSVRQRAIGTLHQAAMRHSGRELPQEVTSLLLEQAKAKVARVRQSALGALMNIHPTPKEAEPLLIEALRDKDPGVRNAAVHSLRLQPGRMKEIVPALIELLKSRDDMIMNQVIYSLAQAGREEKTAIAALIEHYRKLRPASYVRVTVLSALAQCGGNAKDAIPLCVEALKDDNDQLRQAAVQTLMRLDPANKLLVTALVDMYGRERGPYARIGRPHRHERNQKPLGPQAVKELCEILANDKDADRRAGAAIVLGTMVQDPKGAADALKNAMKDADPCVRLQAADSYWLIANDARTPIPVLLAGLKEKDMGLRQYAAQVVAEMGKEATHVVPQLVAALKGQDDQTAAMLIHALSQMGNDAAPAIPALVEIVRDGGSSYGIRARAAQALMPFGREAKDAVPALLDMLKGGPQNRHDRGAAAMALARIATPTEALPALLEAFVEPQTREHDRNEDAITKAIIQFGADAVGPVAELLQDKRPEVRVRAISVLVRFGQQARDIVPQLMAVMEDKDVDVALNAAEAVWKIDRRPEVLPHFMRGLKAKTPYNRVRAARNLMTMGAQAKPAVPDLIAACKDRDSSVRREAYQALMALEPETARNLGDPEADKK